MNRWFTFGAVAVALSFLGIVVVASGLPDIQVLVAVAGKSGPLTARVLGLPGVALAITALSALVAVPLTLGIHALATRK